MQGQQERGRTIDHAVVKKIDFFFGYPAAGKEFLHKNGHQSITYCNVVFGVIGSRR
jgi:hypothetical protein